MRKSQCSVCMFLPRYGLLRSIKCSLDYELSYILHPFGTHWGPFYTEKANEKAAKRSFFGFWIRILNRILVAFLILILILIKILLDCILIDFWPYFGPFLTRFLFIFYQNMPHFQPYFSPFSIKIWHIFHQNLAQFLLKSFMFPSKILSIFDNIFHHLCQWPFHPPFFTAFVAFYPWFSKQKHPFYLTSIFRNSPFIFPRLRSSCWERRAWEGG